ncbi:MAG: hypothetical protein QOE23_1653, partial [Pseudonocardiales bacterium]|nr:hypothetical protein [Pseudonocardiales bacterium]
YQTSPTDRMAFLPQARHDDAWLLLMRSQQWDESRIALAYRRRTRWAFNAGIASFLSGLTMALIPGPSDGNWPRTVAVVIAAAAAVLEMLLWIGRPRLLVHLLMPQSVTGQQQRAGSSESGMAYIAPHELRRTLYDDASIPMPGPGDTVTVASAGLHDLLRGLAAERQKDR